MKTQLFSFFLATLSLHACAASPQAEWVATTETSSWEIQPSLPASPSEEPADVVIDPSKTSQTIDGFGTCFNELGWASLSKLDDAAREGVMKELFSPGVGANFTICRMPVGANDFALDWYSYNETDGDFGMEHFSIANDRATLIPFIKNALRYAPDLKIWASPWCPPSWMKYNKHYASRSTAAMAKRFAEREKRPGESTYMFKIVDNGLPEERQGYEGTDMFIQEDRYLRAYALYFAKFVQAYKAEGIDIFGVMPQNEFNSAQIYPSCCWTAAGLARFVGQHLGPAMEAEGVEVMFGTVERANELLVDTILADPACSRYVRTLGFQWAGKDALPGIRKRYPELKFYQTEQECGNGKNDWKGAWHAWELMKHYLNHGVSVYTYWNTSLAQGGVSRWGWAQNSLVVVNEEEKTFVYTPEYYVMKHVSHYVLPGAKKLETSGRYADVLAFLNPDGDIVVVAGNPADADRSCSIRIDGRTYTPLLKARSINTLVIR